VADRVRLSHLVNQFDMDAKNGDVMDVEGVMAALVRLSGWEGACLYEQRTHDRVTESWKRTATRRAQV
jgi:hypothetical protein